ncbi:hypothetical protein HQQ80_01910 [Microbacteriaceae bacterium VKM Ac-2855]|nr:hypothetical protein [Microbacteriaceae bacterium VKM Ac-2855]
MTDSLSTRTRPGRLYGTACIVVGVFLLALFAAKLVAGEFHWWWFLGVIGAIATLSNGIRLLRTPARER